MATTKKTDPAMPGLEDAIAAAQDETETASSQGLEIPVPNGFEAPEDSESGASFDVLATVKMQDGKLTLEAIDGLPVTAQAEADMDDMEDEAAEAGEDEGFMGAIERSMAEATA